MSKSYLYHGLAEERLGDLFSNTASLCVTSPPYKNSDNYSEELIRGVFTQVYRVLRSEGLLFLNFGHLAEDKFRPFRVCQILMELGFRLNETITWEKPQYRPIQGKKRLNNVTEFIFLMYKNKMPDLDRLAIGIPYADKSNVKRYAGGRDLKCRGNHWRVGYETITSSEQKLHNDRMPIELAELCIKLSGIQKRAAGYMIEPFGGSGTTLIAATKLGVSCVSIEKNSEHFKTSLNRYLEIFKSEPTEAY
jgi:site-specific DNA-methyltransferase (adenine-specific)